MRIRRLAALALALAALLPAAGCKSKDAQSPQPPAVTVSRPAERTLVPWDDFPGRLESSNFVAVAARVSGVIELAPFQEGATVTEGDLLFQIDPRPFEAELLAKQADLKKAVSRQGQAAAHFKRFEQLKGTKAISAADYDIARADLEQAAAEVGVAEAALAAAKLNLEWTKVKAPISGKMSRKLVQPGNLISGGGREATRLSILTSVDPIYCYANVPERSFLSYRQTGWYQRGQMPAWIKLANETEFSRRGRIDFMDNHVDPGTGTLTLRAVFPNSSGDLVPGLFARLRIPGGDPIKALLVPDSAIGTSQDSRYVLVAADDGTVQQKVVKLGPSFGSLRAITEGIAPSDKVIVKGMQQARPGSKVNPAEEPISLDQLAEYDPSLLQATESDIPTSAPADRAPDSRAISAAEPG